MGRIPKQDGISRMSPTMAQQMSQKNRILFITTSSLAANPRLVKEFETLKRDFVCSVLCFKHFDWSLGPSDQIIKRNPEVHFMEIDRKQQLLSTVMSKMLHKLAKWINPLFKKNTLVCALASNDRTFQLLFHAFGIKDKQYVKTVIAHNIGAFYPAMRFAKSTSANLQLDVEDYYPGEALYFNKTHEKANRLQLMQAAFDKADAITYASEGIALECQKQFKIGSNVRQSTILNAFGAIEFKQPEKPTDTIKCVWFSQHIGPNRGLEHLFEAAAKLEHIEFHLIGNPNRQYLDTMTLGSNVKFHNSMKMEALHEFLSRMDVGLALEDTSADHNRNICLTNKILAYAQAGLYILATNTFGQSQFLKSLDYRAGTVLGSSLEETLQNLDMDLLAADSKIERWQKAKSYSWDNEQLKLKVLLG